MPTIKEPFPGWIDNIYGPLGLYIGGGKGIVRIAYINKYVQENAIPVDIVINTIIIVSWKFGLTTYDHQYTFARIFNCTEL